MITYIKAQFKKGQRVSTDSNTSFMQNALFKPQQKQFAIHGCQFGTGIKFILRMAREAHGQSSHQKLMSAHWLSLHVLTYNLLVVSN